MHIEKLRKEGKKASTIVPTLNNHYGCYGEFPLSFYEHICVGSQGEQNFFFFVKFNYNNAEPALLIACFFFACQKHILYLMLVFFF